LVKKLHENSILKPVVHAGFRYERELLITKQPPLLLVVPAKQYGSIISMSYISYILAAHSKKTDVYKVTQGSISKSALLCRDCLL